MSPVYPEDALAFPDQPRGAAERGVAGTRAPTSAGADRPATSGQAAVADPPRTAPHPRARLDSLQALRAIAAGAVVFTHLYFHAKLRNLPTLPPEWFHYGYLGVDLFFVLSGWIIVHVHGDDLNHPDRTKPYLWRRFARVWPLLALLTTLKLALLLVAPALAPDARLEPSQLITSYLLLPHPDFPLIAVAWTLRHEVLFYALFALGIWLGRRALIAIGALWLLVILVAQLVPTVPWWFDFLGNSLNLHFLLGCLAGVWLRRHPETPRTSWFAILPILLLTLVAAGVHVLLEASPWKALGHLALGSSCALLIIALVQRERAGGMRVPRLLTEYGDASYSLYLWHGFVVGGLCWLWTKLPPAVQAWSVTWLVLTFLASVYSSLLLYRFVERPLVRWVQDLRGRRS